MVRGGRRPPHLHGRRPVRPRRVRRRRDVLGRQGSSAHALAEPAGRRPLRVARRTAADRPHRTGAPQRHPRTGAAGRSWTVAEATADSGPHGIPALPAAGLAVDPRPRRHLHARPATGSRSAPPRSTSRAGRAPVPSAPAGIPTSSPSAAWWTTPCSPSRRPPPTWPTSGACRRERFPVDGSDLDFARRPPDWGGPPRPWLHRPGPRLRSAGPVVDLRAGDGSGQGTRLWMDRAYTHLMVFSGDTVDRGRTGAGGAWPSSR